MMAINVWRDCPKIHLPSSTHELILLPGPAIWLSKLQRESNHFMSSIDFSSYLGDFSDFIFASHIADEFFVR
jgi:hypothetical protein